MFRYVRFELRDVPAPKPQFGIIKNFHFSAGELMVVIGKHCKNVSEAAALDYVAGYTIGNDVTDRNIQKEEPTYARGKGMDTFCPAGPFLVSGIDWRGKRIRTSVNGALKQ